MEVRVAPGETIESALRRFKKATQKAGVLAEARKHEHYEKPSVRRKKKSAAPRKRRAYPLQTVGAQNGALTISSGAADT